jgi:nucleoside-diphosphate-sugar epimerase
MAHTVVVTAASGPLGRRVCQRVAADPAVDRVVAIDRPGSPAGPAPSGARPPAAAPGTGTETGPSAAIEHHVVVLDDARAARLCEGAAAIIHLGSGTPVPGRDHTAALDGASGPGDVETTRALLAAASGAGVPTVVVLSSAMVYGAWPGNPVPLTEAAPLRPVPGLPFAIERAETERLASRWREEHAGRAEPPTVAVLRPAVSVGPEQPRWLGRSPWSAAGLTVDDEPPVQFVHLDDVASAVDLARRERLDGPYNVAPDGWLSAGDRRELSGPVPRLPLPAAVAERIASFRWRFGLTGVPPSVLPYTMYSWVVANDRLKAAGWSPSHTNEEAFVEADPGSPLGNVRPRRRQMLSLAALGLPALGLAAGLAIGVRRLVRGRRRR